MRDLSERDLMQSASERAIRYLEQIDQRRVSPAPEALQRLSELDAPTPEGPGDPMAMLALLDEIGSPATMGTTSGRFFGFVIGGSLPGTVAANWLASAWDQNAGLFAATPIATKLEEVSLRWLLDMLHLPTASGAGFVTGGTMANFTCLAAARHAVLKQAGWDVEADGLFGAPPITVVVAEAHPTLIKSLGLLGLGRSRMITVPADEQGRMRADAFPALSGPAIVCIGAGNINTGAFDPANEIIEKAHAAGAWVHVDGAFGLWARACPSKAYLADGIENADSWATDAHKWLNVPYDSGLAFVRDSEALRAAMSLTAAYLPQTAIREPSQYVPELSRRARGVEVWAALCTLGRQGVADLVERCCRHAARFAEGLSAAGYTILNDVVLNQVLVSFGDADKTNRVIHGIQDDGTCWCGGTSWHGHTAMRISVSSWATTEDDVERSLDAMIRITAES